MTNNMNNKTFIWGGKSKLRLLIPYLSRMGRKPDYVFEPCLEKLEYDIDGLHFTNISFISKYANRCDSFVIAIGGHNGKRRIEIANNLQSNYQLKTLLMLHEHSYICETSKFGDGLMMMPGSVINSYSSIGNHCIVNTNASIDHECTLGDGVHVMGGAAVAGRVDINDFATIGTNATVLPNLKIGKGAYVGAGAVVTKDVPEGDTVIGVPAKRMIK